MLRLSAVVLALAIVGAFAVHTAATSTVTPQDADVNKDGAVTIADAISVLPHIGQLAPTPIPLGGGAEGVIARDLDIAPTGDWTPIGSFDASACHGAIVYYSVRSLDSTQGATIQLMVNGGVAGGGGWFPVGPSPITLLLADFPSGGTNVIQTGNWANLNPVPLKALVKPGGVAVRFNVELHCSPAPL